MAGALKVWDGTAWRTAGTSAGLSAYEIWLLAGNTGTQQTFLDSLKGGVVAPYSYSGTLAVTTGKFRWYNDIGRTLTITAVRASVGTAPAGLTVIVDVNKNGTTIYTSQGNRPTIAIAANTATANSPNVTSVAAGDYLTVDIDQIGSTTPGADLAVTVVMA